MGHKQPPFPEHPLALGSFSSWLRLLRASGGIEARFIPRLLFVSLTTLLTSPLRVYERLRYGRALDEVKLNPAPVFIIGHWRTGTTHLHNLLCQDPNFAYVSTFQAMAPGFCLMGESWLQPLLGRLMGWLHSTRLIDNIPLAMEAPQEEDFAIANLCPYSFLHQYSFPRRMRHFFERYILFQGLPVDELEAWRRAYLGVLRKAIFHMGHKSLPGNAFSAGSGRKESRTTGAKAGHQRRLLLKNPANSGRIPALLELFPGAKFIHIYRDPYQVFLSTRYTYHTVLPRSQLQSIDSQQVDEHILRNYRLLMQKFLIDREMIPPGNLVEVCFEELERDPLAQARRIYTALDLHGLEAAEPAMRAYIDTVIDYEKNRYQLGSEAVALVNQHWAFAFDAWGYEVMPS